MMSSRIYHRVMRDALPRVIALLAITGAFFAPALAQTPADTQIQNSAAATYSDGNGNNFNTVSNTVIVTVAKVAGLTITPDAGTLPTVVAGQTGVNYSFRVTNTGNFANQVRFLASGASISVTGPGTVASAFIDVNGNGTYQAGTDVDIKTNGADALSPSLAQNGFVDVIVVVNIGAGAVAGNVVNVRLGDTTAGGPSFDNQAADSSIGEVRTVSTLAVNGLREARGDRSATVDNNAQLQLSLTAPAGPVALGSNITYVWQLCNTGARAASAVTLTNAPAGSNSGVFIIAPIPAGTSLASQVFPAGTLYSTSPLASNPITTATWTTTAPSPLSNTTRVAFNLGGTLAAGACGANINMIVTITTTDATNPISEQGDGYALNSVNAQITSQSPQRQTTLQINGAVLLGPVGQPGATGPTNNNDDYSNRSVTAGIAGVAPGGTTTAGSTIIFSNTVQNTGNANDTFVLTAPTVPAGFTIEISTNGGTSYTTVQPGNGSVTLPVAFGASANILVRVTAPTGLSVLTAFNTIIRAASTNTPASVNDTIDRLYTGFLRLDKTTVVTNATGVGGATDPVPGAQIEYVITYTNISSTGGTNNSQLTANNIVVTENGNAAPNNWGTTTDHVVGATDSLGSAITGDVAGSTLLTDTVPSLAPGQSGIFRFKRQIK